MADRRRTGSLQCMNILPATTLRRFGVLIAAALLTVVLVGTTTASASTLERRLVPLAGSNMTIVDDESWPFTDEVEIFNLGPGYFAGIGVGPGRLSDFNETSRCAGGEVRVETQLKAEYSTVYKDW